MTALAHRLIVPVAVLLFVILFQVSLLGLSFESRALPQVTIILLGLVCCYSILRDLLLARRMQPDEPDTDPASRRRMVMRTIGIIAITTAYVLLFDVIGFYPATAVFFCAAYSLIERPSLIVLPYTATGIAIVYVFFELGLTVLLPGTI